VIMATKATRTSAAKWGVSGLPAAKDPW